MTYTQAVHFSLAEASILSLPSARLNHVLHQINTLLPRDVKVNDMYIYVYIYIYIYI